MSDDLRITKNVQNTNGAKNLNLENTFVREIVHLFDSIRDPQLPALRYSQFLPNQLLSFQNVHDIFLKKSVEMSCVKIPQTRLFAEIKNVSHPNVALKMNKNALSYQNSPINSPRMQSPLHARKENAPNMNFTYRSPQKRT